MVLYSKGLLAPDLYIHFCPGLVHVGAPGLRFSLLHLALACYVNSSSVKTSNGTYLPTTLKYASPGQTSPLTSRFTYPTVQLTYPLGDLTHISSLMHLKPNSWSSPPPPHTPTCFTHGVFDFSTGQLHSSGWTHKNGPTKNPWINPNSTLISHPIYQHIFSCLNIFRHLPFITSSTAVTVLRVIITSHLDFAGAS